MDEKEQQWKINAAKLKKKKNEEKIDMSEEIWSHNALSINDIEFDLFIFS